MYRRTSSGHASRSYCSLSSGCQPRQALPLPQGIRRWRRPRLLFRGAGRSFLGGLGALALGVLVVVLVAAIPVAGGWLEALLVLLGLGALLLMARPGRRRLAEPLG
jgi:hypothetical protein